MATRPVGRSVPRRGWVALLAAALLSTLVVALAPAREAGALEPSPTFSANIGAAPFSVPTGIAVDGAGNVYVGDNGGVHKFDASGNPLLNVGSLGNGNGQNYYVSAVAVDSGGSIYVADRLNARINKYSSGGGFVKTWGTFGSGDAQFNQPVGLTVSNAGFVYVVDAYNDRVEQFSLSGAFVRSFGSHGSGPGQLDNAHGIAIDSGGNVLVADTNNNRLVKYTASGTFLGTIGSAGTGNGQFQGPVGVAVDAAGNIYVADGGNTRIQKLDSSGVYQAKWGSVGRGNGQFLPNGDDMTLDGIAVTGSFVYVADPGNHRVQRFTTAGAFSAKIGGVTTNTVADPAGLATNGTNVYVSDTTYDLVRQYTAAGAFVRDFGAPGVGAGQLTDPAGVALDLGGTTLFVVDRGNNRVLRFATGGGFLSSFGGPGTGPGQFDRPTGIARDADGNILVADTGNDRIQRFTTGGTFLGSWGVAGTAPGQMKSPSHLAVDKAGNVYVAEAYMQRVDRFTATGAFVQVVASYGSQPGGVDYVDGLAVDPTGGVWAGELNNHRVEKFSAGGAFVATLGSFGSGNGQMYRPRGVAVAPNGTVFVADQGSSRVERWTPAPVAASGFTGVTPKRVLDTRNGTGGVPVGKVGAGATLDVTIAGAAGSPVPANATAVVLNLTVTGPTSGTFITAFPAGSARPTAANLVVVPGQTVPNLVTVKVGTGGAVSLFNALGSTHLIADVFGYYTVVGGQGFTPLAPSRILDSRGALGGFGGAVGPNQSKTLQVTGAGKPVPAGASAVVMNVTATQGTAGTYLTAYPAGGAVPTAANLNVAPNQTISNLVTAPLNGSGQVAIYNNLGSQHVIADVVGYYSAGSTARFVPVEPARALDSRIGLATSPSPWAAGTFRDLQLAGQAGVAPNASAVVMNVTATEATAGTYLTVYPSDTALPSAASLLVGPGATVPNLVAVKLSATGTVRIYNQLGTVQVVADVAGYFV